MDFQDLKKNWDAFGKTDPMWAILTSPTKRGNRWDPEEFFATGEETVRLMIQDVEEAGLTLPSGAALDFGCGVGRVTQALAPHFERCVGIDVAASMIEGANRFNRFPGRCEYVLNERDDLSVFADASFDFIYSALVLQHIHPRYSSRYIQEFVRILKPGGLIYFQIPAGQRSKSIPANAFRAAIEALDVPTRFTTGKASQARVKVTNAGGAPWTVDEICLVCLGNHWLDENGNPVMVDDGRARIFEPLAPGDSVMLDVQIVPPMRSGRYLLEFDMVNEAVDWFKTRGSRTLVLPAYVDPDPEAVVTAPAAPPPAAARPGFFQRIRQAFAPKAAQAPAASSAPQPAQAPAPAAEPVMEIHSIPQDVVVRLIEEQGGRVLRMKDDGGSSIAGWQSYYYFVTR